MAALLDLLHSSPSSVNSQPWHFVVAANEAGKSRILKSVQGPFELNAPKILNASHLVVFCTRSSMSEQFLGKLERRRNVTADSGPRKPRPTGETSSGLDRLPHVRPQGTSSTGWRNRPISPWGYCSSAPQSWASTYAPMEGFDPKKLDIELDLRQAGLSQHAHPGPRLPGRRRRLEALTKPLQFEHKQLERHQFAANFGGFVDFLRNLGQIAPAEGQAFHVPGLKNSLVIASRPGFGSAHCPWLLPNPCESNHANSATDPRLPDRLGRRCRRCRDLRAASAGEPQPQDAPKEPGQAAFRTAIANVKGKTMTGIIVNFKPGASSPAPPRRCIRRRLRPVGLGPQQGR